MRAGVLFAFTFVAALAATVMAATAAHAAGPSRNAPALERRWCIIGSYKLEARTLEWHLTRATITLNFENSVGTDATSKRGYRGIDRAGPWSPRIGEADRRDSSSRRLGGAPFKMETLPVTILGRRIVLSHFAVNRKGVRGMISTAF